MCDEWKAVADKPLCVSSGITRLPWWGWGLGRERTKGEDCTDISITLGLLQFSTMLCRSPCNMLGVTDNVNFTLQGPAGQPGSGGQRGPNVSTAIWCHLYRPRLFWLYQYLLTANRLQFSTCGSVAWWCYIRTSVFSHHLSFIFLLLQS